MYEVVQVRLREAGKILYYNIDQTRPKVGDYCIVEVERGTEYGQVLSEPEAILDDAGGEPLRKVLRLATKEDLIQIQENKKRIREALNICSRKIQEHKLNMKLVEAEYAFDQSKIIFYFTAEERIDFRELVKDLARIFKVRIELKQIGVRDEAKLLGGFGPCGEELCCTRFLKDFEPVTIRMAKEQGLPLNPAKISGLCGRLICCLGYEYRVYKELLKELPKEGEYIETKEGRGKVVTVNALRGCCVVELEEGRQIEVSDSCIRRVESRE